MPRLKKSTAKKNGAPATPNGKVFTRGEVTRILARLPGDQPEIVEYYHGGSSAAVIAGIVGMPLDDVNRELVAARQNLIDSGLPPATVAVLFAPQKHEEPKGRRWHVKAQPGRSMAGMLNLD